MNVICIDVRVWTSLVAKLESLAATALRVEKMYDPDAQDG